MTDTAEYVPPKVWTWDKESGGRFANINRPVAGATHEKVLPVVMFEELLAAGHKDAEYDAWLINIGSGDQFGSGFVEINPNSKIPAMMDHSTNPPTRLFESGSMLLYLAEKFGAFLPKDHYKRTEAINWLFWQMGSAPFLGGGFGHFYAYAPTKIEYAINRYAMETKRQLDVLDRYLAQHEWMAGDEYSIADMAICPWYGAVAKGDAYNDAAVFLSAQDYKHVQRWTDAFFARPAVKRGRMVNKAFGDPSTQLVERHDASDFELRTQDKVLAQAEK
jgi:GST-like protein